MEENINFTFPAFLTSFSSSFLASLLALLASTFRKRLGDQDLLCAFARLLPVLPAVHLTTGASVLPPRLPLLYVLGVAAAVELCFWKCLGEVRIPTDVIGSLMSFMRGGICGGFGEDLGKVFTLRSFDSNKRLSCKRVLKRCWTS